MKYKVSVFHLISAVEVPCKPDVLTEYQLTELMKFADKHGLMVVIDEVIDKEEVDQ